MKTTLNLDDHLVAKAKTVAALQRTTLTRLIEEGLRLRLRNQNLPARYEPVVLPVYHGTGGLAAGIDPTSNEALFEAADS